MAIVSRPTFKDDRKFKPRHIVLILASLAIGLSVYSEYWVVAPEIEHLQLHPMPFKKEHLVTDPNHYPNRIVVSPEQKVIYHHQKKNLYSSAVLKEMLMCHAYAFHHNVTYGGACDDFKPDRLKKHQELIDALGLQDQIEFACPRDDKVDEVHVKRRSVIPIDKCTEHGTKIWTPEYVDMLRQNQRQMILPEKYQTISSENIFTIAVHIRRDRITPCVKPKEGFYDIYMPNSYYLTLIDQTLKEYKKSVKKNTARVLIFSQDKSYESLDEFVNKGYQVHVDGFEVAYAWQSMAMADVLIVDKSMYSMIPGILNPNKVIYAPFWHYPLKHWTPAPNDVVEKANAELAEMKKKCTDKDTNARIAVIPPALSSLQH